MLHLGIRPWRRSPACRPSNVRLEIVPRPCHSRNEPIQDPLQHGSIVRIPRHRAEIRASSRLEVANLCFIGLLACDEELTPCTQLHIKVRPRGRVLPFNSRPAHFSSVLLVCSISIVNLSSLSFFLSFHPWPSQRHLERHDIVASILAITPHITQPPKRSNPAHCHQYHCHHGFPSLQAFGPPPHRRRAAALEAHFDACRSASFHSTRIDPE
jgi:hypothetical protein